jgi:hypothetical protein
MGPAIIQAAASTAGRDPFRSWPSDRRAHGRPEMPLMPGSWGSVPVGHGQADGQMTVRRSLAACMAGLEMPC